MLIATTAHITAAAALVPQMGNLRARLYVDIYATQIRGMPPSLVVLESKGSPVVNHAIWPARFKGIHQGCHFCTAQVHFLTRVYRFGYTLISDPIWIHGVDACLMQRVALGNFANTHLIRYGLQW